MASRAYFLTTDLHDLSPGEGEAILRSTGWLSFTPVEFQDALISLCHWRWYQPGEAIVTAGDAHSPLVGIAKGTASVVTSMGPPDTPLTHISYPGWWLGYIPLISGRPTDNETVARSQVFAAVVSKSALENMLDSHSEWWKPIAKLSLYYGTVAANIAADLLIRESKRRCAATLLRMANCRFSGEEPASASITQGDLAATANLSRTTANALLRELEAKGLIARHYNRIELLDPSSLRTLADGDWRI